MSSSFGRIAVLLLGPLTVFAAAAAALVRILPEPLNKTDYLVIGTVATFAALLALFLILLKTSIKSRDLFYKERRRPEKTNETDTGQASAKQEET